MSTGVFLWALPGLFCCAARIKNCSPTHLHGSFWNFNPTIDKLSYILEPFSPPSLHLLTLTAAGSSKWHGLPPSPWSEDHPLELTARPREEFQYFSGPLLEHCSTGRPGRGRGPCSSVIRDLLQFLSPESPTPSRSLAVPASGAFFPFLLFLSSSQSQSHHKSQFCVPSYSGDLHVLPHYLSASVDVLWISPSLASPPARIPTCEAPHFQPQHLTFRLSRTKGTQATLGS